MINNPLLLSTVEDELLECCSCYSYDVRYWAGPGLVVMGRDSCSEGCGFKSQHDILDFLTFICGKNCIVCLKNENKKRPGMAHLKKDVR